MTRNEAIARGLTTYNTGKPCKRGHHSERYVSTHNCAECLRERQRAASPNTVEVVFPSFPAEYVAELRAYGEALRLTAAMRQAAANAG